MIVAASKTSYTPEDLLTMPDGNRYELVDGQLVELNVSMWSSFVAGVIFAIVRDYCYAHRLGWPFPEGTAFQCFAAFPNMVRKPDFSFIRLSRLTVQEAQARGHGRVVPDLAVEVMSPNDLAYEVDEKVSRYLEAGVPLVWVVNPEQHTVEIHRAGGTGTILRENDELTGEDILPGFRCRVGDFFVPPEGAPVAP
jgi:Uma2 family endonuclease